MAADFLTRIKQSPVLCDGAMGTLLYAKGIFINRSYDELNLCGHPGDVFLFFNPI